MQPFALAPAARIIAWRLTEGHCVSAEEALTALYADDADGGPMWARTALRVQWHNLRQALKPFGITINANRRHGHWGYWIAAEQISRLRDILADEIASNVDFSNPDCLGVRRSRRIAA